MAQSQDQMQDTELGKLVAKATDRSKPIVEQHANQIILGVAAVLAAIAIVIWILRSSDGPATAGWSEAINAESAEQWTEIAEQYGDQPVGTRARLIASEI